ncbi:methyltransferase domain-containing protein [Thalassospira mesophila]|uniref:Methyltransferase type 11 domain-containing protein n=1 Tax=Thalassospira mesophila TaxID=1293891 RepID=A0A1Y2L6J9_9PROT|nr:methyltransferase domain-containing protein [Thalassospira mesophila]OSQ40469.1 hypothetical protein TMES_01365 [Thalassospira mesophila]
MALNQPQDVSLELPTFTRFLKLFARKMDKSVLRTLEYEKLSHIQIDGKILDFGGGENSKYNHIKEKWMKDNSDYVFHSANIDKNMDPTFIVDVDGKIPCAENTYNHVISLNTFEHIYDVSICLTEINRILEKNGKIIFTVPFIYQVHGHPNDYSRFTPNYWREFLSRHGFNDIKIESLNWGPFSTGASISGCPGPFRALRIKISLLLDVLYFACKYRGQSHISAQQDAPICSASLGYLIIARKSV